MHKRLPRRVALLLSVATLASSVSFLASAQKPPQPPIPVEGVKTYFIRQDFSDCTNSNVNANNPELIGGIIFVQHQSNGTTTAQVEMTGTPNTTYNLFHKCVGQIGTITTGEEGTGTGTFTFQAPSGAVIAFDMYPNGAPAGNKFQSVPVTVQ
jgi:hypothetical protein